MAFTKPNVNVIWANTGEVIAPDPAKVTQGWISEIPDFEFENWIQNRQDQFNAHINQYGIPVWDSTTEYQAGKSYVQGSNGDIYRAITTNTNKNPTTNPSDWSKAFDSFDSAYSKTESDNRFLEESNNLSDLTNTANARTNLSVYSKSESDSRYQTTDPLIGMIAFFAGTSAPQGFLVCDGSTVSRSTYLGLFNRIGTSYGVGNGSTTFNLPDLRNEFVRGSSTTNPVGQKQIDTIRSHSHTGTTDSAGDHFHTYPRPNDTSRAEIGNGSTAWFTNAGGGTGDTNNAGDHAHTFTTNNTGSDETHPRNISLLPCIKF